MLYGMLQISISVGKTVRQELCVCVCARTRLFGLHAVSATKAIKRPEACMHESEVCMLVRRLLVTAPKAIKRAWACIFSVCESVCGSVCVRVFALGCCGG